MGFKEVNPGRMRKDIPEKYRAGGINFDEGYAVKAPTSRLRPDDGFSDDDVYEADITPITIRSGEKSDLILPSEGNISMGAELEVMFIDLNSGEPVNLYGNDSVVQNGRGPKIEPGDQEWMIDKLSPLGPEGLNSQAEVACQPGKSYEEIYRNLLKDLAPSVKFAKENNLGILISGKPGYKFARDWENSPPHQYLLTIHQILEMTALDFDAQTAQAHTGWEAFCRNDEGRGIGDLALYTADNYNALFASMINAVMTNAPFTKGQVTQNASNREFARRALSTQGGVQPYYKGTTYDEHLQLADKLVRDGAIPIPERAGTPRKPNQSHNDTRPAKHTTFTFEGGAGDAHMIEVVAAQTVIQRRFNWLSAGEYLDYKSFKLPTFMRPEYIDEQTKISNRNKAALSGSRTEFVTGTGKKSVYECWKEFFDYSSSVLRHDSSLRVAEDIFLRLLATPMKVSPYHHEEYLDSKNQNFLKGNFGEIVATIAQNEKLAGASDITTIRNLNRAISSNTVNYLDTQIKKLGVVA